MKNKEYFEITLKLRVWLRLVHELHTHVCDAEVCMCACVHVSLLDVSLKIDNKQVCCGNVLKMLACLVN